MTLPLVLGNIIRHSKLFILSVSLLCMQPPALSQTRTLLSSLTQTLSGTEEWPLGPSGSHEQQGAGGRP